MLPWTECAFLLRAQHGDLWVALSPGASLYQLSAGGRRDGPSVTHVRSRSFPEAQGDAACAPSLHHPRPQVGLAE